MFLNTTREKSNLQYTICYTYFIYLLILFLLYSLDTPVSCANKTDIHVITEILLKVALNTKTQQPYFILIFIYSYIFLIILFYLFIIFFQPTWLRLFQKRVVRNKCDIYVFITITDTSGGELLVPDGIIFPVDSVSALI